VAAEPGRLAGRVALDDQVAAQQADLAALVEAEAAVALDAAPVAEPQRPLQGGHPPGHGRHLDLLGLGGLVVGGGDHQQVAGSPAGVALQDQPARPGRGRLGQVQPARPGLAVQLEGAAHDPEHVRAHAHHVAGPVAVGQGDGHP